MDDGSQGIDDQFIRSAMARLTWQVSPRNKISGYFDEIDKYRGHDMQANYDPETAATIWNSPAYHTTALKWTSPVTSSLFLEAGFSNNTEYYTNEYREGIEKPRGSAEWYRKRRPQRSRISAATRKAGPINTTESPKAIYWNVAATYVKGDHTIKFGANMRWGQFVHTRDANADLVQQYRSSSTGVRWTRARHRPDPQLPAGLRREAQTAISASIVQDSWRLNRLTAELGMRWETLNSSVMAGESPAGRFVPARKFPEVKDVPNWNDFAPRMALVYDLFGNGKTAVKYSLNRYNLSRTTGIAANYNPLLSQTAHAAVARRQRQRHRRGRAALQLASERRLRNQLREPVGKLRHRGAERYGEYPRTWNLEQGVEISARVDQTASR